ncbi:hypothetical protein BOX15_Mlig013196g1 [Macrostomum lignano]|uniref:Uncharacterized protein n=1 Tax=Macrostomum lignano TaxID=282301 RepID=A0A267EHC1_9PLAT|nr:hypothetical protein BOX15_Mlig013196g1 [Macrostomum lignano]
MPGQQQQLRTPGQQQQPRTPGQQQQPRTPGQQQQLRTPGQQQQPRMPGQQQRQQQQTKGQQQQLRPQQRRTTFATFEPLAGKPIANRRCAYILETESSSNEKPNAGDDSFSDFDEFYFYTL